MLRPNTPGLTVLLALLTALGPLSTDFYLPSLPFIAADFGVPSARIQLTLSAFLAGFAAGQLVHGPLSDRIGRKPVLLAGLAIYGAATLGCALAPSVEAMIACRFLQALGASGPIVLARAVVRDLYDGPRAATELSRMASIMGVVPAVAPLLGGVLQVTVGWRAGFAFVLAMAGALFVVCAIGLPETLRQRAPERFSLPALFRTFAGLLRHGGYRAYIGLMALSYSGLFAWISGSAFVLQGRHGVPPLLYALSFTVVVAGFVGGTVAGRRSIARRGPAGTIGIGVRCMAAGGLVMLAGAEMESAGAMVVAMAVYACGVGMVMPSSTALALGPFPDRAGAASSLLGMVQMSVAAGVGVGIGHGVDASALPMAGTIAAIGIAAWALFAASARARAA